MHLLAIDPSTRMGWALLVHDHTKPKGEQPDFYSRFHYGTFDLGRNKRPGQYFISFKEQLRDLRRRYDIVQDNVQIIMEGEAYGATGNQKSRYLSKGWPAILFEFCERCQIEQPVFAAPAEWRKSFIGRSIAPKEVGAGMEKPKKDKVRREWIKNEVLKNCTLRGFSPQDDNTADAIGIIYWALHGGKYAQELREIERKAAAQAKRDQKTLDLQVAA